MKDDKSKKDNCPREERSGRSSRGNKGKRPHPKPKMDESRSNNPAWYFNDAKLADQVSQMSFQHLAGYPINYDGKDLDVPNIVNVFINPSPGVQLSATYTGSLSQDSAINLAGFKVYSRLSAFTGRVQSYAPQDVSMMILAFGELISTTEFIRRAFGVAFTMNMRNRDYPRHVLEKGMFIDSDDLFQHFSDYRTEFNTIITLINQLPIPKNVAYFDKCASLYERIYLDSPSNMAQTIVPIPFTSWELDEQSYSGGSILKTIPICASAQFGLPTVQPMSYYLAALKGIVTTLLNSTSLHTIYTDILNLATKQSVEFWRMDYLMEGYSVMPVFDTNFLLQMHNATVIGAPYESQFITTPYYVTPYNDVYPNPNKNAVYYNPAFPTLNNSATGLARTGSDVIIDMMTDAPTLTDRIEVTRYASIGEGQQYTATSNVVCNIDTALPDHYVTLVYFNTQTSNLTYHGASGTLVPEAQFRDISSFVSNIEWFFRFIEVNSSGTTYTGRYTSDVNYYTVVDASYLRKLHDFVGLALYDLR